MGGIEGRPLRIVHVITGLPRGGAEMMLYKLLSRIDRTRFHSAVLSLREEGPMAERIRELGTSVESLGMRETWSDLWGLVRLRQSLARCRPDLVQTWLYHADLLGGLAAKGAGSPPVVWGVRMSNLDPEITRPNTLRIARLCARWSRWLPTRIVCCSESGRGWHSAFGYDSSRMCVIPNGFDVDAFRPDPSARQSVRQELATRPDGQLVGLIARFAPQKDHETFIAAAAKVHARFPAVHFLLAGQGVSSNNPELCRCIERAGIRERCHLLGARDDVPRLTAACDVCVSSSSSEAFSNAIGEAMACGVPCAVTDVGDSGGIVGDTGRIAPPRNPDALAAAIGELLSLDTEARSALGLSARRRIVDHFEMSSVVRRYEELYLELTREEASDSSLWK